NSLSNFFIDSGYADKQMWTNLLKLGGELIEAGAVSQRYSAQETQIIHVPRGDMREREERERYLSRLPAQAASCLLEVRSNVAMREHHAFRHSRRARGVDDRGKIFGDNGFGSRIELRIPLNRFLWPHNLAHAQDVHLVHIVHYHDVLQLRFLPNAENLVELLARGEKNCAGARVLQNEGSLFGGERWIDRDIYHTQQQTSPVSYGPLETVFGYQRYSITFSNLPGPKLLRHVINPRIQPARRDIVPGSTALKAHDARQFAVHGNKEDVVQRAQAAQARTSIPERSRSTTGSAAAAKSYSRLLRTHAVASSSIAPNKQAAAILSEISGRMLPFC